MADIFNLSIQKKCCSFKEDYTFTLCYRLLPEVKYSTPTVFLMNLSIVVFRKCPKVVKNCYHNFPEPNVHL